MIYPQCENSNKLFTVCVFNTQAVRPRGKCTEVIEFIRDQDVDMMFLIETWMKTQGGEDVDMMFLMETWMKTQDDEDVDMMLLMETWMKTQDG